MTTGQQELQGALLRRGRKTFWVCGTSGANEVQVYSTNGQPKSFPMKTTEAATLVQRAACAFDMDAAHDKSAQSMVGRFAAMGRTVEYETARAVLDRWT